MVGVINPNDTQTLDAQKKSAETADYQLKPGEKPPSEASSTLHVPEQTGQTTPAPTNDNQSHGHKLSGGAIAGIVIGVVAFLAICAALAFFLGRTKSLKEALNRKEATVKTTPGTPGTEFIGTPGYLPPGSPFSSNHSQAEYGNMQRESQQHFSPDAHPAGWTTPTHPHHMSMSPPPHPQ